MKYKVNEVHYKTKESNDGKYYRIDDLDRNLEAPSEIYEPLRARGELSKNLEG